MADKTINQLTQATGLTDSSLFVIEQNSTAKQANWGMMKNYISPGVAAQYSTSATYNVGDYVIYNGSLYRCNTAITTGEAWTAAHWTAAVLGDDVGELKSALSNNAIALKYNSIPTQTVGGITITQTGPHTFHVSGTCNSDGMEWNLTYSTNGKFPDGNLLSDYNPVVIEYKTTSGVSLNDCYLKYLKKDATHSAFYGQVNVKENSIIDTSSFTDLMFRIAVRNGATVDGDITITVQNRVSNFVETLEDDVIASRKDLKDNTDLNDVKNSGIFFIQGGRTYTNYPYDSTYNSWMIVCEINGLVQQYIIPYFFSDSAPTLSIMPLRRNFNGSSWSNWKQQTNTNAIETLSGDPFPGQTDVDLDGVLGNHFYLLPDSHTYTNKPSGFTIGFLEVVYTGGWCIQLLYQFNGNKMWKRRGSGDGSSWENWQNVGGGNSYTNNYSFNEYNTENTITVSPSITTDTNSYLAPTGTNADRTADILAMLNNTGVCRLGYGNYFVRNLIMPPKTTIIGAGAGTNIVLSGTSDGFCIKLGNYCTLKDVCMNGNPSGITIQETIINRHGILWQGNYTQDPTPNNQPINAMIENVRLFNFAGGGITCYDTGYGTFNSVEAINVYCESCCVGIYIPYWSEFHKFTNVRTASCYYGCINNGGNNVFVNCDFSTCKVGFLMDNSTGQSPNNTHGSCVGCVFNHTNSNTGIGIKVLNCHNGFMFTGCQIFYSQVYIEDSDGIVISSTNFGSENCDITVSGGGAIVFSNNMHQTSPTKTITDNNNVHFANCYVRDTGAVVS